MRSRYRNTCFHITLNTTEEATCFFSVTCLGYINPWPLTYALCSLTYDIFFFIREIKLSDLLCLIFCLLFCYFSRGPETKPLDIDLWPVFSYDSLKQWNSLILTYDLRYFTCDLCFFVPFVDLFLCSLLVEMKSFDLWPVMLHLWPSIFYLLAAAFLVHCHMVKAFNCDLIPDNPPRSSLTLHFDLWPLLFYLWPFFCDLFRFYFEY